MRTIPLEDGPVRLVGSLDLDRSDRGITPRRLPHWTRPQVPPFMELMVTQPSGVRLEFTTTSSAIELEAMLTGLELPTRPPADAVFDLVVDDEADPRSQAAEPSSRLVVNLARRDDAELIPGEASTIRFEGLPAGSKRCALWLPASAIVELRTLRIDDGADIEPAAPPARPRWMHHGSSISYCAGSFSPTRTWPAVAARLGGVELLNLGLGGNCHLDPFVARTMRDEPADVISLKAGINVVNADSLKERTFAPALHGFIDTVRDGKPETPFLVVSPIVCPSAEDRPGPTIPREDRVFTTIPGHDELRPGSLTLRRMREIIEAVVAARRAARDANLHYLDGLELFGEADVGDLPDALHPNGDGYVRMGERFAWLAFGPGVPLARQGARAESV